MQRENSFELIHINFYIQKERNFLKIIIQGSLDWFVNHILRTAVLSSLFYSWKGHHQHHPKRRFLPLLLLSLLPSLLRFRTRIFDFLFARPLPLSSFSSFSISHRWIQTDPYSPTSFLNSRNAIPDFLITIESTAKLVMLPYTCISSPRFLLPLVIVSLPLVIPIDSTCRCFLSGCFFSTGEFSLGL